MDPKGLKERARERGNDEDRNKPTGLLLAKPYIIGRNSAMTGLAAPCRDVVRVSSYFPY